jgi:6-phosphogluconolactonase
MHSRYIQSALGVGLVSLIGGLAPACGDDSGGSGTDASSSSTGMSGCGPGAELCGGACTVTAIDPKNCGACGNACAAGEACDNGSCALACSGGATMCGQSCVDTSVDPENCGMCGEACDAAQEVCLAGACVATCGAGGLIKCGDSCVDTTSDPMNCGQCGMACAAGEKCVASQCAPEVAPKGVYTMSNDPSGNSILGFARAADGSLSPSGSFTPTGGKGTGMGLGNQHGLIFDQTQSLFFAVNAGDNTISMLSLKPDGSIELLSNVDSGGVSPISVTVFGSVVYVVNAGRAADSVAANISGFKIMGKNLSPIAGSTQPLSAANPGPAQIQFSPDGKTLVVTEKGTNVIDTYTVAADVAKGPTVKASSGQTPFGFDFSADKLIVSEAAGGMAGMSSASSYSLGADGVLTTISGAVPTTRTAACWVAVAGDYAYVANAGSMDVTGFKVGADGSLTLLDATGVTGQAGNGPTDEDVTDGGDFLYVLNGQDDSFSVFQITGNGSLTKKPDFHGLPATATGIVAR